MKKALIIEDSDDIREGTAEILDLAGYKTYTAKNGKIGVDLASKVLPDIILCDIMMPELDGYGVLYLLQKNQQTANIPFIFMTAKAERADMRKAMDMGADDYLTKPFDDVELFSAIESRLKKRGHTTSYKSLSGDKEVLFDALKAKGKTRTFLKKQIIFVENDEPMHLFFIKKGQVKIYKCAPDGRELSSTLYNDGDYFGHETICRNSVYAKNAAALCDTELILVPKADFITLLFEHQEMANTIIGKLSGSLKEKDEQLLRLAYYSVRKRVAETLVQAALKFNTGDTDTCTLKISRDDLAALVGTASETVSRMLADFKAEKLIEKNGNAIQILSIERLKQVKQ